MIQWRKFAICVALFVAVWVMPAEWIPLAEINPIQQRLLAIFVLAAGLWILEPIPVFATSITIISLELMLLSNAGIGFMVDGHRETEMLLPYTNILNSLSSPIIILFLGGFALAVAASKYELDINLARVLLKPFGHKPQFVMMGLMLITAVFSMFMSNTATTVMMLAILTPVLAAVPHGDPGAKGLVLSIPVAANLGGIGTPIGTPPNAIALQYLEGEHAINFIDWMMLGVPFVCIMLAIGWFLLCRFFPPTMRELKIDINRKFRTSPRALIVYCTFVATIVLWLTTAVHGMNSYVVAILPLAVFTATGIISKEDLKQFNWDVIWLVAGGIAIGIALSETGLADLLATSVDFNAMPSAAVFIGLAILCYLMANLMSNTATANLLMPVAAAVATTLMAADHLDSITPLILVVALSASMGMVLPVSTPPNALAYSSGKIDNKDMAKIGIAISLIGLTFIILACLLAV
ncbi:SLC13 family permease [Echinimonas agarilytica]|uniref:SLC13 family permease n=1 Tax=Echinimonas agarilytica TaxID=1215918 RepID=A0AA41W4Q3_9GAMM|nr:SLC13 family permease [Echinimonas agarilytica]MCM2678448.1 SLC13 family permease [Echinimonas agarilytica]